MQHRVFRREFQRLAQRGFRFVELLLLRQRPRQQREMAHAARMLAQNLPANGFGLRRLVPPQRLHRGGGVVAGLRHQLCARSAPASRSAGR